MYCFFIFICIVSSCIVSSFLSVLFLHVLFLHFYLYCFFMYCFFIFVCIVSSCIVSSCIVSSFLSVLFLHVSRKIFSLESPNDQQLQTLGCGKFWPCIARLVSWKTAKQKKLGSWPNFCSGWQLHGRYSVCP